RDFRAGRTTWRDDVLADPAVSKPLAARYRALDLRAWANAALVKGGRLVALMTVHQAGAPHVWAPDEVALLERAAARARAAAPRATAAAGWEASEADLRLLVDHVPAMVAYVDRDLRFRLVNDAVCRYYGREREQVHGRPLAEVVGPEAYARLRPWLE